MKQDQFLVTFLTVVRKCTPLADFFLFDGQMLQFDLAKLFNLRYNSGNKIEEREQ